MATKYCRVCDDFKPIEEFSTKRREHLCRGCLNERSRLYKKNNREKIKTFNRKYKQVNKEDIRKYNNEYLDKNREKMNKDQVRRHKARVEADPAYKIAHNARNRIRLALCGKTKSKVTKKLLDCDFTFLRNWLESQFTEEMTYENYGKVWHIDHVIPCAKFSLEDEKEQHRCFNWTNLQPMIAIENITKNDKADIDEINEHIEKVKKYIEDNNLESSENHICVYDIEEYLQ
jgi:hypothetical protein